MTNPQQLPADTEIQNPAQVLVRLADVIASRKGLYPSSSYVARLLAAAPDAALKKNWRRGRRSHHGR